LRKQAADKLVVEDIDPEVWKRLPFWVRELLKMLRKGNRPD